MFKKMAAQGSSNRGRTTCGSKGNWFGYGWWRSGKGGGGGGEANDVDWASGGIENRPSNWAASEGEVADWGEGNEVLPSNWSGNSSSSDDKAGIKSFWWAGKWWQPCELAKDTQARPVSAAKEDGMQEIENAVSSSAGSTSTLDSQESLIYAILMREPASMRQANVKF